MLKGNKLNHKNSNHKLIKKINKKHSSSNILKISNTITIFIILFLGLSTSLIADNIGTIKGELIDMENHKALTSAKVSLKKIKDSIIVAGTFSKTNGEFEIKKIPSGKYFIEINYIGFEAYKSQNIEISDINKLVDLGKINMISSSVTTGEVNVVSERATIEYELDKKVINVDKNLTAQGASAVDVLQNTPSVSVDFDGNVSMRGSSNLKIMIDGKEAPSSGNSRTAILENIPASSIESIEIMNNTSAKYSPEGEGGIINIKLKKRQNLGLNGLFSTNVGQNDKYGASMNLNYSLGFINLFLSDDIKSERRQGLADMKRTSYFYTDNVKTSSYLDQYGDNFRKSKSNNFRFGFDLNADKYNLISATIMHTYNDKNNPRFMTNLEKNSLLIPTSFYKSLSEEEGIDRNLNYTLSYKLSTDTKNKNLSVDFTYLDSYGEDSRKLNTDYFFNYLINDSISNFTKTKQNTEYKNNYFNSTLNYSYPIDSTMQLEIGSQYSRRNSSGNVKFWNINPVNMNWEDDFGKSNKLSYEENVISAYTTFASKLDEFSYQLGLRAENATTNAIQSLINQNFEYEYFSLFPTLAATYKFSQTHSLQASYSRRINRPNIGDLDPRKELASPKAIMYGNPLLKPEFVNSYEFNQSLIYEDRAIYASVYYRYTDNPIRRYSYIDSNDVTNTTYDNFGKSTNYGFELTDEETLAKWWKLTMTASFYKSIISGNEKLGIYETSNNNWSIKANSNWNFWDNTIIQVNAFYNSPMLTPQGEIKAMYSVDFAIKKDFFEDKLSVNFRVGDIFNSMKFNVISNGSSFYLDRYFKRETRVAMLTLSYKINSGIKAKQNKRIEGMDNSREE